MSPRKKKTTRANGKSRPKSSRSRSNGGVTSENVPSLSQAQKDKLRQMDAQLNQLKCAHSDAVARASQLLAQRNEVASALSRTAAQMVQSLGLDLDDTSVAYTVNIPDGVIEAKPRLTVSQKRKTE